LTASLQFGTDNVLAVRVDNSHQKNTRFYSGSGIYRHVWLIVTDPIHVANLGVFVAAAKADSHAASLAVQTTVRNDSAETQRAQIDNEVFDPQGASIARASADVEVAANSDGTSLVEIPISKPALWFPEKPQMCRLVTRLIANGKPVDEVATPFGIRKLAWSVTDGFTINAKPYKLKGGCLHSDNGVLGECAFDRAEERKIQLVQAAGFTAIRTAHNPPSPALLDACDRLGMLVMDESFDCWGQGKNKQDYSVYFKDWWQRDLSSMIQRDRNHPSVVVWSIGNEIPAVFQDKWAAYAPRMAQLVHALDSTRPVTNAVSDWVESNPSSPQDAERRNNADTLVWGSEDIVGTNYHIADHVKEHDQHPHRILISTESSPPLGVPTIVLHHPYVVGDFVWTAMDYLGESGLGRWFLEGDPSEQMTVPTAQHPTPGPVGNQSDKTYPWHGSPSGNLDLLGNRKPASHLWNICWDAGEKLYLAVRQPTGGKKITVTGWGWFPTWDSWTWPGLEGQPIEVEVYSRYPKVRLYLNDKLLGENGVNLVDGFKTTFKVAYAPGVLKAVGVRDGKELESFSLKTAGEEHSIRLTPDLTSIAADGQGLSFVTVEVVDQDGMIEPNAGMQIHFSLEGPGTIAGLGNADLKDPERYQGIDCNIYHGRALVVLRSTRQPGILKLSAAADGLPPSSTEVATK
jgi:beta-galactosidase